MVGVFRAGGDTRFGLILDVSTMWGGSILVASLAAFVFDGSATLVYMLLLSDELIKIPFTTWRYRTRKWLRSVTRDETAVSPTGNRFCRTMARTESGRTAERQACARPLP